MNYFYNSTKGTSHRPLFPTSSISVFETGVAPSQERNCSLKCYKFYTTPVKKHNYYDSYFKIYPNPADNQLNLSSEFNLIKSVIIYNSLGQVVYNFSDETNSNLHQIDVSNLNNGIYQLMVLTPFGTTISKKIIITHIK